MIKIICLFGFKAVELSANRLKETFTCIFMYDHSCVISMVAEKCLFFIVCNMNNNWHYFTTVISARCILSPEAKVFFSESL